MDLLDYTGGWPHAFCCFTWCDCRRCFHATPLIPYLIILISYKSLFVHIT